MERESLAGGVGQSKKLVSYSLVERDPVTDRKPKAPYPLVVTGVIEQLRALRHTNIPISCSVARAVLVSHLRVHASDMDALRFSDRWMHSFMHEQLGWAYRTATKAGRKRPVDWQDQCLLAFLRISRTVMRYNIKSARLIVNADQTGISLFPLGNKTWDQRGIDQVKSVCHDERRQVSEHTLLPILY